MTYYSGYPYSDIPVKQPSLSRKWDDELYHYQVEGAKHGVRRYQYKDGSLTPLGRVHYGVGPARKAIKVFFENRKQKAAEKKAEQEETRARIETSERNANLRNHPERMTEEELTKDLERARLETQHADAIRNLNRSKAEGNKLNYEIEKAIKDREKTSKDYFSKNNSEMTNEELRDATERKILQKKYQDAVRELRQSKHPLTTKILNNMLETSVATVTNKLVNGAADKVVDVLFKNDPVKKLQNEKNMLELKKQIERLKKNDNKTDKLKEQKEKLQLEYDVSKLISDIDKSKKKTEDIDKLKDTKEKLQLKSDIERLKNNPNDEYNTLKKTKELLELKSDVNRLTNTIDNSNSEASKLKAEKELLSLRNEINKLKSQTVTIKEGEFKGYTPKQVEDAKNILIDLNQLINLQAKVGKVDLSKVDSYKKTDKYKDSSSGDSNKKKK